MKNWNKFKQELLKNPAVKQDYKKLEPEYRLARDDWYGFKPRPEKVLKDDTEEKVLKTRSVVGMEKINKAEIKQLLKYWFFRIIHLRHKIGHHGAIGFETRQGRICAECNKPIKDTEL